MEKGNILCRYCCDVKELAQVKFKMISFGTIFLRPCKRKKIFLKILHSNLLKHEVILLSQN